MFVVSIPLFILTSRQEMPHMHTLSAAMSLVTRVHHWDMLGCGLMDRQVPSQT